MKKTPWSTVDPLVKQGSITTLTAGTIISPSWFECIDDFDFWLTLAGHADVRMPDGTTHRISRGSCLWIAPNQGYHFKVGEEGLTTCWLHFDFVTPEGRIIPPSQIKHPEPHSEILNSGIAEQLIRRIILLGYQQQSRATPHHKLQATLAAQLLKGLLLEFELSQVQKNALKPPGIARHHREVISEAVSWIYFNPIAAVSASVVAEKFGYSLKHFSRIFREVTGKPPSQTIIEARIQHAKELLHDSSLNITEIADRLHYENAFYFSKQFRKATGESPSQYRKKLLLHHSA